MNITKLKITRFIDGGHSWFSVKRELLQELGIDKEISACSYQKGNSVYLEEDCDAAKFFDAYAKKMLNFSPKENSWDNWEFHFNCLFEEKKSYAKNSSPIRNYAPYCVNKINHKDLKIGKKVRLYGKVYTIVDSIIGGDMALLSEETGLRYAFRSSQVDAMTELFPLEKSLQE